MIDIPLFIKSSPTERWFKVINIFIIIIFQIVQVISDDFKGDNVIFQLIQDDFSGDYTCDFCGFLPGREVGRL